MNYLYNKTKFILFSGIFCLAVLSLIASGGGGGGGGGSSSESSDSGTETTGAGSEIIELSAVLGPIVGASVWVSPINDTGNLLASGTSGDSDDITEAGRVSLEISSVYADTPLYVNVSGGVDIDANDDGVRDDTPTENDITLEFAVPTSADLEGMSIVANPLLLYASYYIFDNIFGEATESVDDFSDPETIRTLMQIVARALIEQDVDGDGTIDWQDIISFHPLVDQDKSRIPWDYVLDDIDRLRQDYAAILSITYNEPYFPDPLDQQPIEVDIENEAIAGQLDSIIIHFATNKNNYTNQDLVDGQGNRGGTVTLPAGQSVTYVWCEEGEDGEDVCTTVENDVAPPLWVPSEFASVYAEAGLSAYVGGSITDPQQAPVGEYTVEYATGDGQTHQETLYLHENREETYFHLIPMIEVDDEGFIDSIVLQFEDENGNPLDEPAILNGAIIIFTWGESIEEVNSLVRGEGYYAQIEGEQDLVMYTQGISLLSPTAPIYPTNNGHKIYYEDANHIAVQFEVGDGVGRSAALWPGQYELYPQIEPATVENDQVTVTFAPASATDREVLSIRYKFDNGDWQEVDGSTLVANIPEGATILYVTAKDISDFYVYPPYEIDLTE
jgi:hypothetical protein